MKKTLIFLISAFCLLPFAFALDPATITMTNLRAEAVSPASSEIYYRGEVVHLTNCVAFAGSATNSSRQDLTGLTILVSVGDTIIISQIVTGRVTSATSGVWNASITLRTNEGAKTYLQLKLTNTTSSFVYPFKFIDTKTKL